MVFYRRKKIKGGIYFFTATLRNRKSRLLVEHVSLLRRSFRRVQTERSFTVKAIVILPDHVHTLWELPIGDHDYAERWKKIKGYFTREIRKQGVRLSRDKKGEYDLWQSRYWEHVVRDEEDLENHINYIHYNPVKHKRVKKIRDWKYSSFHRYVEKGLLPDDWAGEDEFEDHKNYGE